MGGGSRAGFRARGAARVVTLAVIPLLAGAAGSDPARAGTARGGPGTGTAYGSVRAPDGSRLPGASVVLTSADGRQVRVSSGSLGTWRAPDLAAGGYSVSVRLAGFETATRDDVAVPAGGAVQVDLELPLAGVRESVRVFGDAPRGSVEAQELRERPAVDLGEALSWTPGLWRLRKGAMANDVVLRGLQSRDLNVLIDGQRVYGACPNHMDPAAFHVDFSEVERVEVGKGPFDVKNQGGLGGTVNVVTRRPATGWHATPALSAGSWSFWSPSLVVERGGERVSALAGYSYRRGDVPQDGAGRPITAGASYRGDEGTGQAFAVGTAWARVVVAPAPGHTIDVAYTRQDAGDILYPYLLMDAGRDDTDRANVLYEARGLGRHAARVRVQAYLTRVDHWMSDERRASAVGKPRAYSMATQADTRTVGGKAEAVVGGLTVGVEAFERTWDATNEMAGMAYAPQAMIPGVVVRVAGAFAEYERRLGGGVGLAVGARLDEARSEADASKANEALYAAYQGTRSLSARDVLPAGKARLAWRRGGIELAAGVGHAERAPEANERYLALRRAGTDWVGDPELDPSRNTTLDVSAEWTHAGFRVGAAGYWSRVDGYVAVYDQARRAIVPGVPNALARSFANVDARLRGGELYASLPVLFGRVFVSGDLSYVRGDQGAVPERGIAAGPLAEMPPLRGHASARYDDGIVFGAVEGTFAADQERIDVALQEQRTPGWGTLDVSVGFRRGKLRATGGVANVFDRLYTDHLSYQRDPFRSGVRVPEPGRRVYVNAAVRF